jgi:hypothetical protein
MLADQRAIARIARLAAQDELAVDSMPKQTRCATPCPKREFFFPMFLDDEERDGHRVRALTRTYGSGRSAGDPHGRELIGYVPWQFGMLDDDARFDVARRKLTDRDGFFAAFSHATVERNDPMFLLRDSCCWWSGQSWPYATTRPSRDSLEYSICHRMFMFSAFFCRRITAICAIASQGRRAPSRRGTPSRHRFVRGP